MAPSSSTSSSEKTQPSGGPPTAFVLAVMMLIVIEVLVRRTSSDVRLPYNMGDAQYRALRDQLLLHGPAEIAVVGSSRIRDGIVAPLVSERLRAASSKLRIANYATGAGTAEDGHAAILKILGTGKPTLLVLGVEPRYLEGEKLDFTRCGWIWSYSEWRHAYGQGFAVWDLLPEVIRNEIADRYQTFRFGRYARTWLQNRISGVGDTSPFLGEATIRQLHQEQQTLANHPISAEDLRAFLARDAEERGGNLVNPKKLALIEEALLAARRAGVPVLLLETPISDILGRESSKDEYASFYAAVESLARSTGARFYRREALGVTLSDADFTDSAHVNATGAPKVSAAFADRVLLPYLAEHNLH